MITIKSNLMEVVLSLNGKVSKLGKGSPEYDTLMRSIATTVLAEMKIRIHQKGRAADGTTIGNYSTNPIYISTKANPGRSMGAPLGKSGVATFKTGAKEGKLHTSKYFAGGYNQYKTSIGRNQLGTVNLSLSGQLDNQLSVQVVNGEYWIGWPDEEKLKRAKALEKKYGKKIWALTVDESQIVAETASNYLKHVFSQGTN